MPETPPPFAQLIPPLGPEILADDALDAVTAAVPQAPGLAIEQITDDVEPYGKTWQWDWARNRFVRYGGAPAPVHGLDNLRQWVLTAHNTARFAHPIYDEECGMEESPFEMIGTTPNDPQVQEAYMQACFDAFMIHDRITDVTQFDFWTVPGEDEVSYVDFEIHTDDGDVLPLSLALTD